MLHLNTQLYNEITAVFRHLSHLPIPPDAVPFELEVMKARARAHRPVDGSMDRDYFGAVEELGILIARCKREARRGLGRSVLDGGSDQARATWRDRAMRVGVVLAGVLVEMRVSVLIIKLTSGLPRCSRSAHTAARRTRIARYRLPSAFYPPYRLGRWTSPSSATQAPNPPRCIATSAAAGASLV